MTALHSYFMVRHFPGCFTSLIPTFLGAGSRGRVLAHREVESILIYDRRIGMVSLLETDETDRRFEGIYSHRR